MKIQCLTIIDPLENWKIEPLFDVEISEKVEQEQIKFVEVFDDE